MAVTIRCASLDDLDFLVETRLEVLRDVFSIPPGQDVTDLEKANREYYTRAISGGEHIACFAFEDGVFAGCGGICFSKEMPSPDNPTGNCGYLMNIYTRPAFRRKGVGNDIVRWLVGQAHQRRIIKISLEASSKGRALYEKLGFVSMKNQMQLSSDNEKKENRIRMPKTNK